jgi:hypothetical protein
MKGVGKWSVETRDALTLEWNKNQNPLKTDSDKNLLIEEDDKNSLSPRDFVFVPFQKRMHCLTDSKITTTHTL